MSTWAKGDKNLSDIRDVKNKCRQRSAAVKSQTADFLRDVDIFAKVLPFSEPTAATLNLLVRKHSDFTRTVERNFIERAKECSAVKSELKTAVVAAEENFSQAVTRAQMQGLYFD